MSTLQMGLCWPLEMDASAKAVLISLADQANDEGGCWPAVGTIASRTCLSERTVQTALGRLQRMGLLRVSTQGARRIDPGYKRTNYYQLTVRKYLAELAAKQELQALSRAGETPSDPAAAAPMTPQQLHPAAAAPRSSCTHDPAAAAPKPSVEPNTNTPIPPAEQGAEGGQGLLPVAARGGRRASGVKAGVMKLADWLALCRSEGVKPIPPDDPVWAYASRVGLSPEMVRLAWLAFKRKRLASGKGQRDWRATFRNAVRGNWERVWFIPGGGEPTLSTVGEQLRRELDADEAQAGAAAAPDGGAA